MKKKKTQPRKKRQRGKGVGEASYKFVQENAGNFLQKAAEDPALTFQVVSNAQRFASKNIMGNNRPIRYLKRGEIHVPNHNFTGPGTRIDLPEVKNFAPYNNIDACSREHDLAFENAFQMPLGESRQAAIRDADKKAIACYSRYPNEEGYNLATTGINSKMKLEDVSPQMFDKILGQSYRGASIKEKKESFRRPSRNDRGPRTQLGGSMTPAEAAALGFGVAGSAILYGEYKLGKYMYDKLKNRAT